MAGVGQSDLPMVSAGTTATPLVTPANPQISSDAVRNLSDAFRQGFITQDDIVSRIGDVAQSKNKALLQQLGEFVSPGAIEARKNELDLAGQTAAAQTGLVGPAAEAKKWEMERTKWNTVFNGGVDAFQQYGPWFGHSDIPTKPDGTPDFAEMGKLGQGFKTPVFMAELAQQGLKPDPGRTIETEDPSGKKGKRIYNAFGVEITPGSPGEAYYRSLMSMFPGRTPTTAQAAGVAPQKGVPVPSSTAAAPSSIVSPAGAPASAEPTTGEFDPNLGMVTKSGFSTQDVRSNTLDKNQGFKIWEGNKANIDSFHNIIDVIRNTKNQQERLEAERGLVYTLSELQQNQAQGSIPRSVIGNWEHIVARAPLTEQIKNIIGKTTGSRPLTEDQVESLITLGKQQIAGKATGAIGGIELASKQNPTALTTDEQRLLETGGQSEVAGERAATLRGKSSEAGGHPAAKKVTLTGQEPAGFSVRLNGTAYTKGQDGKFYPSP